MKIISDMRAEVPDTNAHHFNLKKFSDDESDDLLVYGYHNAYNNIKHEAEGRKVLFDYWSPTEVMGRHTLDYVDNYSEIYTICPFLAATSDKYKYCFYPFNEDHAMGAPLQKKTDVMYHGGIHGKEHLDCLEVMRNFNYDYITKTSHINKMTEFNLRFATKTDLSFREKLIAVGESKISVCYNLVPISEDQRQIVKHNSGLVNNKAFDHVDDYIVPQFKVRAHEAAFCKTVNLVYRDPWNLMEDFYAKDEFVYFDDKEDLEDKIEEVLEDWDSYEGMRERAFKRSQSYTNREFVALVESGKGWKNVSGKR